MDLQAVTTNYATSIFLATNFGVSRLYKLEILRLVAGEIYMARDTDFQDLHPGRRTTYALQKICLAKYSNITPGNSTTRQNGRALNLTIPEL